MITYVDTSSLLKLLVDEPGSDIAELVWDAADVVAASALLVVEARAALAAAARGRRISPAQHRALTRELGALIAAMALVEVTGSLISDAADLAEEEGLRGHDAVHLASALLIGAELLTSADGALCEAAMRRGLHVVDPLDTR